MTTICDAVDGPVARLARLAVARGDVSLVLPYVTAGDERVVQAAFAAVPHGSFDTIDPQSAPYRQFLETAIRRHRLAEGAPWDGLRPAGVEPSPVVGIADRAIVSGIPSALASLFPLEKHPELIDRFAAIQFLKPAAAGGLDGEREYTLALHRFLVWSDSAVSAGKLSGKPVASAFS